jgi:hypothetical protein
MYSLQCFSTWDKPLCKQNRWWRVEDYPNRTWTSCITCTNSFWKLSLLIILVRFGRKFVSINTILSINFSLKDLIEHAENSIISKTYLCLACFLFPTRVEFSDLIYAVTFLSSAKRTFIWHLRSWKMQDRGWGVPLHDHLSPFSCHKGNKGILTGRKAF